MINAGNCICAHKTVVNTTRSWSWWWAGQEFPPLMNALWWNWSFPTTRGTFVPLEPWHIGAGLCCFHQGKSCCPVHAERPLRMSPQCTDCSFVPSPQSFEEKLPEILRRVHYYRFHFSLITFQDFWFGQDLRQNKWKQDSSTLQHQWILLIQRFPICHSLCRWDLLITLECLKTVQNVTKHCWHFTAADCVWFWSTDSVLLLWMVTHCTSRIWETVYANTELPCRKKPKGNWAAKSMLPLRSGMLFHGRSLWNGLLTGRYSSK